MPPASKLPPPPTAPPTTRPNPTARPSCRRWTKYVTPSNRWHRICFFPFDDDTGRTVVKVVDASTDEVIRQIPSEEVLAIAKALDKLQGVLIKQEA